MSWRRVAAAPGRDGATGPRPQGPARPMTISTPIPAVDPPGAALVEADVARALAEDIGGGDATAGLLPDRADQARLLCKESAVVCGRPWFDACHRALDPGVRIDWHVAEGQRVAA